MANLSFFEKSKLERFLGMSSGYVLNFSNRTFEEFIADSVKRELYSGKYNYSSCSKANLLRKFWEIEPNHIVGKLIKDLIDLAEDEGTYIGDTNLMNDCRNIAKRLLAGAPIEDIETIGEALNENGFESLVNSIRESIYSNEPEAALDRLHTFIMKFLRQICQDNGIIADKSKPLHSLLGEYIKTIKVNGLIKTQMTERILKSSISTLEAFNEVRNDYSYAHDNPILNYDESLLIFNNVVSSIRFIMALEAKHKPPEGSDNEAEEDDDLPF